MRQNVYQTLSPLPEFRNFLSLRTKSNKEEKILIVANNEIWIKREQISVVSGRDEEMTTRWVFIYDESFAVERIWEDANKQCAHRFTRHFPKLLAFNFLCQHPKKKENLLWASRKVLSFHFSFCADFASRRRHKNPTRQRKSFFISLTRNAQVGALHRFVRFTLKGFVNEEFRVEWERQGGWCKS